MNEIRIPTQLKSLLYGELDAAIGLLATRTSEILADNKIVFFPDYTDHGIEHVARVLNTEIELIPSAIWELRESRSLLRSVDAAVLIGATLLHDIAMHLHPAGFLELVSAQRFKPLPWFEVDHEDHRADVPWDNLWHDYIREARRFSDRILINLIGEPSMRQGWKFHNLPDDIGAWTRNHFLVIGEFIRRHHARLAHEIAIYGFPGIPPGDNVAQFPSMGSKGHALYDLADLIGLSARSHGISLRVCQAYLNDHPAYSGTPRPMGSAVLFPMALLRVADYLQLEYKRAPAVLLQLHDPQSPVSVKAWESHRAVRSIESHKDPSGIKITIDSDVPLDLYLQLSDLLQGLQKEMDHSTAVLNEVYGRYEAEQLHLLILAKHRVHTNLTDPKFRGNLPYVPARTGFSADPNILALLVEPLYGKFPGVGVREVLQNAVDAVAELRLWCHTRSIAVTALPTFDQTQDVLLEFIENDDGAWILRCTDRGIGMTEEVLRRHFFQAGASFRWSDEWVREFTDNSGEVLVARTGRFGIGAFATFLLGDTFRLWTRHASEPTGFFAEVAAGRPIIQIQRVNNPFVGTRLEIDLTKDTVNAFELNSVGSTMSQNTAAIVYDTDWFVNDWPDVARLVTTRNHTVTLQPEYEFPFPSSSGFPEWATIHPQGFSSVHWGLRRRPALICNGIRIQFPDDLEADIKWPLKHQLWRPSTVVVDSENNLPLTIQRYQLSRGLPFVNELARDVILSFMAHSLVIGPTESPLSYKEGPHRYRYPLVSVPLGDEEEDHPRDEIQEQEVADSEWGTSRYSGGDDERYLNDGQLRWFSSDRKFVPCDPWLYSLLGGDNYIVYGTIESRSGGTRWRICKSRVPQMRAICWDVVTAGGGFSWDVASIFFSALCKYGIRQLGRKVIGSRVLISARRFDWEPDRLKNIKVVNVNRNGARPAYHKQRLTFGEVPTTARLQRLLDEMEGRGGHREMFYVAEIATEPSDPAPQSLLATIWNECLSRTAIPYEAESRRRLIENARAHSELRRHIEAWEEMRQKS